MSIAPACYVLVDERDRVAYGNMFMGAENAVKAAQAKSGRYHQYTAAPVWRAPPAIADGEIDRAAYDRHGGAATDAQERAFREGVDWALAHMAERMAKP